jgi:DNA ligase (NAD+)
MQVDEVGERIANSVLEYFQHPANLSIIEKLEAAGLRFEISDNEKGNISQKLQGKSFVITGTFQKFSRDEIKIIIEKNGGKNLSGVSGGAHFLLAGNKPGPDKIKKADALKISIISEDDFARMIE